MADYVLLYTGGRMPETDQERDAAMKAWESWLQELGGDVKDAGNPFSGAAKTIASDGAVSDGSNGVAGSGYSILKADSIDEAVAKSKGCPVFLGGGGVTVFETLEVM